MVYSASTGYIAPPASRGQTNATTGVVTQSGMDGIKGAGQNWNLETWTDDPVNSIPAYEHTIGGDGGPTQVAYVKIAAVLATGATVTINPTTGVAVAGAGPWEVRTPPDRANQFGWVFRKTPASLLA